MILTSLFTLVVAYIGGGAVALSHVCNLLISIPFIFIISGLIAAATYAFYYDEETKSANGF